MMGLGARIATLPRWALPSMWAKIPGLWGWTQQRQKRMTDRRQAWKPKGQCPIPRSQAETWKSSGQA